MKLSKVDAAKTIGVSRQTLYAYIKSGRISADPEGTIDTAELLRAGFILRQDGQHKGVEPRHDVTPSNVQMDTYHEIIEILRQQLADARERELAYREQLALLGNMLQEAHRQNQRLLDMPRQVVSRASDPKRNAPAISTSWKPILDYMRKQGTTVTTEQVKKALNVGAEIRHKLNRMVQRGVIQRVEPGVYRSA